MAPVAGIWKTENVLSLLALIVSLVALVYSGWTNHELDESLQHHQEYAALQVGRVYGDLYLDTLNNNKPSDAWLHLELRKYEPIFRAANIHIDPESFTLADIQYNTDIGMERVIVDSIVAQGDDATLEPLLELGMELEYLSQTKETITQSVYANYTDLNSGLPRQLRAADVGCTTPPPAYKDDSTSKKFANTLLNCLFHATAHHADKLDA